MFKKKLINLIDQRVKAGIDEHVEAEARVIRSLTENREAARRAAEDRRAASRDTNTDAARGAK